MTGCLCGSDVDLLIYNEVVSTIDFTEFLRVDEALI